MEFLELFKFVLFMSLIPRSWETPIEKGGKKQVIVYHPKPRQSGAIVLYGGGNEGSGQDESSKQTINALANNVDTVTSLVKAQSEIIENLGHQVSSVVKGTGNKKELKKVFDKIANHSGLIFNITKKQNNTIKHVDELAGVWSATTVDLDKRLKHLEEETDENEEEIEEIHKKIMQKLDRLEEEVKCLHVDLKDANARIASSKEEWPNGKYCILANGRCPMGFKRHEGHLKSLYLYSSHSQFVNEAKFGNSSIGCFGSYCGEYGNFIGSLTLVTCCK